MLPRLHGPTSSLTPLRTLCEDRHAPSLCYGFFLNLPSSLDLETLCEEGGQTSTTDNITSMQNTPPLPDRVLFSGPPGTGKTMAAEVIAHELQLDLYKVDLSGVVSKYIDETEKNLSKIFHEAKTSNTILFFDEADALFGKRTEVSDAHDRYANIETGYLL